MVKTVGGRQHRIGKSIVYSRNKTFSLEHSVYTERKLKTNIVCVTGERINRQGSQYHAMLVVIDY